VLALEREHSPALRLPDYGYHEKPVTSFQISRNFFFYVCLQGKEQSWVLALEREHAWRARAQTLAALQREEAHNLEKLKGLRPSCKGGTAVMPMMTKGDLGA
jgi:hypothetical protein